MLTSFGLQGSSLRGLFRVPDHGASLLKQPSLGKQTSFPVITQKCFKDISLTGMLFLMVYLPKSEFNYIVGIFSSSISPTIFLSTHSQNSFNRQCPR